MSTSAWVRYASGPLASWRRSAGLGTDTMAVYWAKVRQLPFGTPVVPPEDTTTARSSGRARGSTGSPDSAAASSSSRWWPAPVSPTPTTGPAVPAGTRPAVSGKTTSSCGSTVRSSAARRSSAAGADR